MKTQSFILLFLIISVGGLYSSTLDTKAIPCDTSGLSIYLNCVPVFAGMELQENDLIIASFGTDSFLVSDTIFYNPLIRENNVMYLDIPEMDLSSNFGEDLNFKVFSGSASCIAGDVSYSYSVEENCSINLNYFSASRSVVTYPFSIICRGTDSISPVTNLHPADVDYTVFPVLPVNNEGIIFPGDLTGDFTVFFASEYCLSDHSFNFSIIDSVVLDLPDTMSFCWGVSLTRDTAQNGDGYYLPGTDYITVDYELTDGATYLTTNNQRCAIPEYVTIDILDGPPLVFDIQDECDRTVVTLETNRNMLEIEWSNGEKGMQVEVFNSDYISVSATGMNNCVSSDTIFVEVKKLELPVISYGKVDASCWTEGKIDMMETTVRNNVGSIRYRLHNTITGAVYPELDNVPEGLYHVEVIDERDCIAANNEKITVLQRCLEEYPVFTPNNDNIEDTYFIPVEGNVKIYNIKGELVRELITPAYWDGNNGAGKPLPMGTYAVVTHTGKIVNVTIVK